MFKFERLRRLTQKNEYDLVFSKSKKLVTPLFIVFYQPNSLGFARLGLALSKKNIRHAHQRNRMKRLIREQFRIATLPCFDLIFVARQGLALLDNKTIIANLELIWDQLSLKSDGSLRP